MLGPSTLLFTSYHNIFISLFSPPIGNQPHPQTPQREPRQLTPSSQRTAPTLVQACHYGLLEEQLVPCKAQWEKIAIGLRFHSHEIENIKADPMNLIGAPASYLRAVLTQWLKWAEGDARKSESVATLEALKTAVNEAGFPEVAQSLTLTDRK